MDVACSLYTLPRSALVSVGQYWSVLVLQRICVEEAAQASVVLTALICAISPYQRLTYATIHRLSPKTYMAALICPLSVCLSVCLLPVRLAQASNL